MGFKVNDFIDNKMSGMESILNHRVAPTLANEAREKAYWKDRTTHARGGLRGGAEGHSGEYTLHLDYSVEYGQILENGSKPHNIPRKKGGYWKHPGTKGFHTLEKTLVDNKENIVQNLVDYWNK